MRFLLFTVMSAVMGTVMARVSRLRACGSAAAAHRLYRLAAWALGLTIYGAMAVQEGVLYFAGLLTWQTGLPLHLCSMMGLLSLPMLASERRLLWHLSLYLGLPGAALALLFPAVLPTPWPLTTALSFYAMHAGLVLAPLLPLCLGRRPAPQGAAEAGAFLLAVGIMVMAVNERLGSNYLFVSGAVPGTPLTLLTRHGRAVYRLALGALCALVLAAEGAGMAALARRREKCRD